MVEINKLHFKNNVEILRQLPDNSIDAFFEDPPFNSTDCKFEYVVDLAEYWKERKRVAKETTSFIIKAQMPFTFDVGASNKEWYRHRWIWVKDKAINFLVCSGAPLKYTEDLLVFSKIGHYKPANSKIQNATYNPQIIKDIRTARNPKKQALKDIGSSVAAIRKKQTEYLHQSNPEHDGKTRHPTEILYYPVPFKDERIHPTQSPVDLWRFLIRTYTNVGDTIFDGYSGSGTIPVAADIEKRNWIACENSEQHFPDAENRIKKHLELKKYGYAKTEINNQAEPDLFTGHY